MNGDEYVTTTEMQLFIAPPEPPKPPRVVVVDVVKERHFVERTVRRAVTFGGVTSEWWQTQKIELPSDPPLTTITVHD